MNINDVLDTLIKFYPWLYTQTGLQSWQLLTIALAVLFLLILFLGYQRKTRVKRIHAIQNVVRSDIIGINLTGRDTSSHNTYERRKATALLPDDEEEQQSWGQTTKEWRNLTEKIRNLQHEISKYKRSEKNLKEQITELKSTNESLLSEISKNKEHEIVLKQQTQGQMSALDEFQTDPAQPIQTRQEIKYTPNEIAVNELQSQTTGAKNEFVEQSETPEGEPGIPLDIKELKAIADLARRLQARSQQHQGE